MSAAPGPRPARARTLGFLLRELYEALQRRVYADLAADGHPDVREVHSPVLRSLPPEGARVADLARACGLTKQSMAYVVGDLEQLGYVTVRADERDRRAKQVRLSGRGEELVAALVRRSAAAERDLGRAIGAPRASALRRSLEAAVTRLAAPGGETSSSGQARRAGSSRSGSRPRLRRDRPSPRS